MMYATGPSAGERLSVGDIELEVIRRGAGRPILLLHGMQNVDPRARYGEQRVAALDNVRP